MELDFLLMGFEIRLSTIFPTVMSKFHVCFKKRSNGRSWRKAASQVT